MSSPILGKTFSSRSRPTGRRSPAPWARSLRLGRPRRAERFPQDRRGHPGIAFAPDGKTVAAAGDNIYLYDPATGKERLRIDRKARTLAFSRDGSVLTGGRERSHLPVGRGQRTAAHPGRAQDSAVEQILVTPDGRSLFTTDQDGASTSGTRPATHPAPHRWGGRSGSRGEFGPPVPGVELPGRLREQPDSALRRRARTGPSTRSCAVAQVYKYRGRSDCGGVPAGWQVAS